MPHMLCAFEQRSSGAPVRFRPVPVDDDRLFCDRFVRALASRGFTARTAMSVAGALEAIKLAPPAFAGIDLRLGGGIGLDVIHALMAERADARGVILTGYGAIATAVMAVKIGAFDYLAKPANADDKSAICGCYEL